MEPKLELTSVDLRAICTELDALDAPHFEKAYLYPDTGLFRLKLRNVERGRIELLAAIGEHKRLHLADPTTVPDAPDRPPNFAKMVRNQLGGKQLIAVDQIGFDRIVSLRFRNPSGPVRVIFELFGEGNVVVIGTDDRIVDCYRTVRLRSRTIRPGGEYEPPVERINPMTIDRDAFFSLMNESDTDLVRTLATQLNLGGRFAEELCTRAEVTKTRDIADATEEEYDAVFAAWCTLRSRLQEGDFDPIVYSDEDGVVEVSPFPLEEFESFDTERFSTMSEAVDAYFRRLPERSEGDATDEGTDRQEERERLERIIQQQEQALEQFDQEAERYREQAELLYAHYDAVHSLLETVENARDQGYEWAEIEDTLTAAAEDGLEIAQHVTAIEPAEGMMTIEIADETISLVVGESLEHNADRLYQEAKEVEAKRAGAEDALEETKAELAALDESPEGTSSTPDTDDMTEDDWLNRASIPIRRPDRWYERFRWFHTSDGFLAIGGRNAKQNEELINKYTDPNDRIFHTQAHGGPMVVLKATAPDEPAKAVDFPETTLEEVAQFAVSYSSVWKDGRFAGDVYAVDPPQVSKQPESGEYLETGAFAVRGDREYYRTVPVGVAVGIQCSPETRVIGGPPQAIESDVVTVAHLEPGRYAQSDVAKRLYRLFRERFADEGFVRRVASPDLIQAFLPPGGSHILDDTK